MDKRFVAGVGAANIDFHGRSRAALVLHDSNPGFVSFSPGGVTRNILENVARLGVPAELLSALGDDFAADYVLDSCSRCGIGTSHVRRCTGTASSSYVSLLDENGDMYVAMSDMRILQEITPEYLEGKKSFLRAAAMVVCDPCLSSEALDWISGGALDGIALFADPVSTAYAARLRPYAHRFFTLKPNRMELETLTGLPVETDEQMELAADALLQRGTQRVVVSLGRRGCYWADRSGRRFYRVLKPVEHMVNATGAGDAFLGGLIYAEYMGLEAEAAADWALAAGILSIRSEETVSRRMSAEAIKQILEE